MKIGEELLLIIAFTNSTTLGMVRVFGHRTREEILVWVDRAAKEREVAADEETVEDGFDEALKKQLDELFTEDIGL
jgi:hypothetical protein